MRQRCLNPKHSSFKDYGGRGIAICQRWLRGDGARSGYECFFADMGQRPSKGHSIDRRDNDGNYEPSNCRWATAIEQAANKGRRARPLTGMASDEPLNSVAAGPTPP